MFNSTLRIEALNYDVGTSEFFAILWMGRLEEEKVSKQSFFSEPRHFIPSLVFSFFKKKIPFLKL